MAFLFLDNSTYVVYNENVRDYLGEMRWCVKNVKDLAELKLSQREMIGSQ